MSKFVVCALYHFVILEDFESLRDPLHKVMDDNGVRGTLLLALEGINGTISGTREGIDAVSYAGWQVTVHTDSAFTKARIKSIESDKILKDLNAGRAVV